MLTAAEVGVIESILWSVFALFTCSAAWVKYYESGQTTQQKTLTRENYRAKWLQIKNSRFIALPELGIKWLLEAAEKLPALSHVGVRWWIGSALGRHSLVVFWCLSIGVGVAATFSREAGAAAAIGCFVLIEVTSRNDWPKIQSTALSLCCIAAVVFWPRAVLELPLLIAAGILLVTLPFFAVVLAFVFGAVFEDFEDIDERKWLLVGAAMSVSMVITVVAIAVGTVAAPHLPVPQTLQLVSANILCDGVTMYATVMVLGLAVGQNKTLPIPVAIFLDLLIAAGLACLSLWLGVIGTELQVEPMGVLQVLMGRDPSGANYELGPLFWAMHTVFLPTVTYLGIIIAAWIGRLVVLPVLRVFERGREVESPHNHTAMLIGFFAVVFLVLAGAAARMQENMQSSSDRPESGGTISEGRAGDVPVAVRSDPLSQGAWTWQ